MEDQVGTPEEVPTPLGLVFMAEVSITQSGAMSIRIQSNMMPLAQLGAIEAIADNVRHQYLKQGTQVQDNEPLILT